MPWSNIDPERRNTLLLVGGIVAVVAISLLLAGYGYYNEKIAPKRETVLRVGDRSWDVDYLQRRTNAQIINNNLDRAEMQKNIEDTLKQVRDEELVRKVADAEGIKLTEEQMLEAYRTRFGLPAEAKRDLITLNLRSELRETGLSLSEFEDIVKAQALDKIMSDKVRSGLPAKTPHVQLGLIQLGAQSQAIQVRKTIFEEKESFAVIAARESSHPSKEKAGDVGWVPREALPKEVADVAFGRDELFLSDVIENEAGFFIIAVRGKEERDLTEESKEQIVQQKRAEQLEKAKGAVGVAVDLTTGQQRRIAVALGAGQRPVGA
jgi:parvulin-like peptidyl-prolyl isomerase